MIKTGNGGKYKPKINLENRVNSKWITILFFAVPLIMVFLALGMPFFRHIVTFGTFIFTAFFFLGAMAAKDDRDAGVKRKRPEVTFKVPEWMPHVFFVIMILISAGLRLGWYLVPVCWLASWVFFYSLRAHIRATYIDEPSESKS